MNVSRVFRGINALNPSTHGRNLVASMAEQLGALPANGVYEVEPGVFMDLRMSDYIDTAIYFHSFEIRCVRLVCEWLRPGAVFLDIGANIGFYSLMAGRRVYPDGRVIAFEPNPKTAERMKTNILLNRNSNIELRTLALSDRELEVPLYMSGRASHGEASMRNQGWVDATSIRVSAARLDTILPHDLSRLDCIKIDVEGAECLVFAGAEQTVKRYSPAILLEINSKAAGNFGHDALDATRMLLDFCPNYEAYLVRTHSIVRTSLGQLERSGITNANLWLSPVMLPQDRS